MKVNKELVKNVGEVARLKLSSSEIDKFVPEFKEILDAFSKLDEVDTKSAKPSFQPIELKDRMREDKEEQCLSQEDALKNSPNKEKGYFKGPKII